MFPRLHGHLANVAFPAGTLGFNAKDSRAVHQVLSRVGSVSRLKHLYRVFHLLPTVFASSSRAFTKGPVDVRHSIEHVRRVYICMVTRCVRAVFLSSVTTRMNVGHSTFYSCFGHYGKVAFSRCMARCHLGATYRLLGRSRGRMSRVYFAINFGSLPRFIQIFAGALKVSPSGCEERFR